MDDEGGAGMGEGAAFLLGRMSAQRSAAHRELNDRFAAAVRRAPAEPAPKSYDAEEVHEVIDGWKAAVRSRDTTIDQLRAHSLGLANERDQYLARITELEAEVARLHKAIAELGRQERAADRLWEGAVDRTEELEIALDRAASRIAELQGENDRLKRREQ